MGTEIPAATLDAIYDWYQYRQVCDNDRFGAYFNRQLRLIERQYMLYLRNDMTTWDPMVVDYMERQIMTDETGTSNLTTTGKTDATKTGDVTHKSSGHDVVDTSGTSDNTRTLNTNATTDGTARQGGTDKVTSNDTRTDDLIHTRNTTDTRSDDTTRTTSSDGMTNDITDNKQLQGATPDSAMYGTGSTIGLLAPDGMPLVQHDTGAPGKLNWTYVSGQSEAIQSADRVTRDKSQETNTGTVTSTGTGDTTDTGTVTTEGSQDTTYGKTETDHSTVAQTGTIGDEGTTSGKQTTQYGRTLTDTHQLTDTTESTGTQAGGSTKTLNHKERYTGRHETPTELLRKAQQYIIGSNSLKWLLSNLETCFFQIYEGW